MDFDAIMELVNARVQADKAKEAAERGHLTLGHFIDVLSLLPAEAPVITDQGGSLSGTDSYRGYYEQLAFKPDDKPRTVGQLLSEARAADGETFWGYKGGEYRMSRGTWIWLAKHGHCGRPIVGIEMRDGTAVVMTADDD